VETEKIKPGHFLTTWNEPNNPEDVDYYRVRVYKQGVLKKTHKTRSHHFRYVVPDADRGTAHRFRVTAVDEDENMSAELGPADQTDDLSPVADEGWEVGDVRKLSHVSVANWLSNHTKWLRANGQSMDTTTYSVLFAEIGYTYGGSGSSFNLPDLNGRHSIGVSSIHTIGVNDGDVEASRLAVHAHANDATSQGTPADTTYTDIGTGDQLNTPGADYTQENTTHSHNTGFNTDAAGTGSAQGGSGSPTDLTRQGHQHGITGYVGARDNSHDHQGHGHGNHGHNHGHNNQNHHHGHGHNGHGHGHQHDQKKRPHLAVHFVIKVLP
jgi:microcystin-dependent protein